MITKVTVKFFKQFKEQLFELGEHIILAGPNNSGKSTLLQAVVVWNLAMRQWLLRRKDSKAKERRGVPITRKDFTSLPLREMGLLWTDTLTGLQQGERTAEQKQGSPRLLTITLEGEIDGKKWQSGMEFKYTSTEQVTVKPSESGDVSKEVEDIQIVHIPPFSGIGAEETRYVQREYQDLLIGQGKPGDILRNLLLEIYERCEKNKLDTGWNELCDQVQEIFRYTLLAPQAEGRPFIVCEYLKGVPGQGHGNAGFARLDIATAGSGFLQVLLILAFIYARPATVLLMDEPDAHLHVILQKQVYDRLRAIASQRKCQLIIATHSEVLIDNTGPKQILSFYQKPHPLRTETERDEVREAVKRLTATDLLLAETSPGILYLEGNSDFNILRAWAKVLGHCVADWFSGTGYFWHNNQGCNPQEAKAHFFALQAVVCKGYKGLLLLDGDNRNLSNHELCADGLAIERWKRYEIENYLLHPVVLKRFMELRAVSFYADKGMEYLEEELPKSIIHDPLKDSDYMERTPVSKSILPDMFKAAGLDVPKDEYYLIAEIMTKSEIPKDVIAKLDAIAKIVL